MTSATRRPGLGVTTIVALFFAALLGSAQEAQAAFKVKIESSDGPSMVITDNVGLDTNPAPGIIQFTGAFGGFNITALTVISKPVIGNPASSQMDINTQASRTAMGQATLTITATDTGFSLVPVGTASITSSIGGTTQGTVSAHTFLNAINTEFAMNCGTVLQGPPMAPLGPGGFNDVKMGVCPDPGPFSLTLESKQTLNTGQSGGFDYFVTVVPNTPCTGSIGDFIWHDLDHDGIQDPGEPGINGVTVNLYQGMVLIATTVTPTNAGPLGFYQFTGLCAGDYTVEVPFPQAALTGYTPTDTGQGTPATDSNVNPAAVNLPTDNSSDQTIDFGFETPCTGSIGDFVWDDLNHNGIQDPGEPGIDGVTVNLIQNAMVIATTVTAVGGPGSQHGYYQFPGLCAGCYTVEIPAGQGVLTGFTPTTTNAPGSTTANDSNGSPAAVCLPTDNSSDQTIDFGYQTQCTGSIGDFVWHDLDHDGIQDPGEPGIDGVTVNLKQNNVIVATTVTAVGGPGMQHGYYQFPGLCAGCYTVEIPPQAVLAGFTPTTTNAPGSTTANDSNGSPAAVCLPTDNSSNQTIDFGYQTQCTGTIGDFVWSDLNNNGRQDVGEPGINGVKITLMKPDLTVLGVQFTAGNGAYLFTGLCAGDYVVQYDPTTLPPGYFPTTVMAPGTNTANDSNPNPSNVHLPTDNSSDLTIDFGFVQPSIDIRKQAEGGDSRVFLPGANVTFTITVTNTGLVPLTNIVVTDPLSPDCRRDGSDMAHPVIPFLAPGASFIYMCTVNNVQQGFTNQACASGTANGGFTPSDCDTSTVLIPRIDIRKQAEGPDSRNFPFGANVPFQIVVTNTGDVPLVNVMVTDAQVPGCANNIGNLAVGQVFAYNCQAPGVVLGFTNTACVTGSVVGGPSVTDCDDSTVTLQPAICWLTGGGGKYALLPDGSVDTSLKFHYGGNVFPGCDLNGGMGGNWNYIDDNLKLHLKGKAIQSRNCGNVDPPHPPGSTSPETPFNFIEFQGTGSVAGIGGNKANYPFVYFIARAEDRNEPGTPGGDQTAVFNDRFYIQVYTNPADIPGSTIMFLDSDHNKNTLYDAVPVSVGNLQIHISSCGLPNKSPLTLFGPAVALGTKGVAYDQRLVASGGTTPVTYSIQSGPLPPGLAVNASTGQLSGTPTAAGAFTITSKVVDATGAVSTTDNTLMIANPPPVTLACPTVTSVRRNVSLSTSFTAGGGIGGYTFAKEGTWPSWLTLNASTGAVGGKTGTTGTYTYKGKVTSGTASTVSVTCSVTVTN